jgi:hypothetical protein
MLEPERFEPARGSWAEVSQVVPAIDHDRVRAVEAGGALRVQALERDVHRTGQVKLLVVLAGQHLDELDTLVEQLPEPCVFDPLSDTAKLHDYFSGMPAIASAAVAAVLAAANPGYDFARSLADAGRRPAGSAAERTAHLRVARAFDAAGLAVAFERFTVPGHGRSRDVVGVYDGPASCLYVVMAHADSMPRTSGAVDNASGVGVLVSLAPRLRAIAPHCDVWLVATGAEERLYTGRPNHLGASALVRRVRREGRTGDLRIALALDEVGRGRDFWLRSGARVARAGVEAPVLRAVRVAGGRARWVRDEGTGNSDHREFQLAGLPAAKLGQPDNPCRHEPCDRSRLLQARTFTLVRRAVERLLG